MQFFQLFTLLENYRIKYMTIGKESLSSLEQGVKQRFVLEKVDPKCEVQEN